MADDGKLNIPQNPQAEYKDSVKERMKAMRSARRAGRAIPNLSDADATFDFRTGNNRPLSAMGGEQEALEKAQDKPTGGFSPQTIQQLKGLKEAMTQQNPDPQPAPPPEQEPEPEKPDELKRVVRDMDDHALVDALDRIQRDVINNDKEREAVEKRLEAEGTLEVDIEEMLSTGRYTQTVPIAPKLRVKYRTLTPYENQELRRLLWAMVDKDPRLDAIASDLYGMMLLVAAVMQINSKAQPEHMTGPNPFEQEFDEDAFLIKFRRLNNYPAPLIHAIGVHGTWFDQRCRRAFTSEAIQGF
jgi:hypothetical protein